jgi:ParB family chromosome partitioning protein
MSVAKGKSRLGRGLNSLMGYSPTGEEPQISGADPAEMTREVPTSDGVAPLAVAAAVPHGTPAALPVAKVIPNPRQPRRTFDDVSLAELAESIKANGLIQPIVVRAVGDHYELIAGERRLRACRLAGLATVPAFIRAADELEQAQMALVENVQREDLNPVDRAAAYHTLIHELGLTQSDLSARIGEDRSVISNHLRLLDLPPDVQMHVRDGSVSLGHAKVLCGVADPAQQSRLANLVVNQSLSVRNLERILTSPPDAATPPPPPASAHVRSVEVALSKQLGLRVQLRTGASSSKGKVVIHYKTLDEFDALMTRMGTTLED